MTVKELIEKLEKQPQENLVRCTNNVDIDSSVVTVYEDLWTPNTLLIFGVNK